MKCKILHLPTGQCMYWDSHFPGHYEFFYNQYEVEEIHRRRHEYLNVFTSKGDAIKYINYWSEFKDADGFEWDLEETKLIVRKEYFQIVGVDDV